MAEHNARDSYDRLILHRLDALGEDVQRIEGKVETLLIDVAMLKVKSGVWGAVAGCIPAAVAIVVAVVLGS